MISIVRIASIAILASPIAFGFPLAMLHGKRSSVRTMASGDPAGNDRRSLLADSALVATVLGIGNPECASAQPKDFANIDTQAPPPDGEAPFVTLSSGVRVKDFKVGSGETAKAGSTVSVQCNGRLLNLNGVAFYNTK